MKGFRKTLTFTALCLAVGLVAFSVSYTLLGQGPTGNVGGTTEGSSPAVPGEMLPGGEPGPVGQVNELFEVIVGGEVKQLEEALRDGADPNSVNPEGASALQWAILGSGETETVYGQVKALLTAGANPNQPDRQGMTAMHSAALHGSEAVMDALISLGGDPNISTAGQTPYELAMLGGNVGAVSAIEQGTHDKPANTSFLKAVGLLTQKVKKGFLTSTTDEERKQVIRKAVDDLVSNGFLTKAAGTDLFRQLTEVQKLHEWKGGEQ